MNRQDIADRFGDEILLLDPAEQFDSCIVGVASRAGMDFVAVYDEDKVIAALIESGMDLEEAEEWFDFNIHDAFMGERTPMFMTMLEGAE